MLELATPISIQYREEASARLRLQVCGVVQGVGFRPFVHHLASEHALHGFVLNDNGGVIIEVEGPMLELMAFKDALVQHAPPMAHIDHVSAVPVPPTGETGFVIRPSEAAASGSTLVSPDIAICDECLAELFDPSDRRYHYPFINCTNCGPRFTIIQGLPYDRPQTTMAAFELCPECRSEYEDPDDRRFHAQPNACPKCGPQLEFQWLHEPTHLARNFASIEASIHADHALHQAQQLLADGGIVAVKGIGGFHLACDATDDHAVDRLRQAKARGDKPFAIMVRDLDSIFQVAHADADEIALLTSRERPIVLLKKRADSPLSKLVAPGNPLIGVMLPYTPLHYLLFAPEPGNLEVPPWLVMTSANHSGQPIVTDNEVAIEQLADLADALLMHNRPIHIACDDSVVRVFEGHPVPLRRSRGYAPLPIHLPHVVRPTLAVGGEIKNTFCLGNEQHAFMSQHIGDMETLEIQQSLERAVAHMQKLFHIKPEVVACDLHPGYRSTRWAEAWVNRQHNTPRLVRVQHHHAHIAALMAEHGLSGDKPVIGICFDGTGYGTDGAIWGGEVLIANYANFERFSHLDYVPLPGGDSAVHKPYRMALAALYAAGIEWDPSLPPVQTATDVERAVLLHQLRTGMHCVPTSSMGRLFDVVAALCGVCQVATYEAQAAIELEAAVRGDVDGYAFALPARPGNSFSAAPVLQAIVHDLLSGVPAAVIASRFHNAVADLILHLCEIARDQTGLNQVALSGGVFQNFTLLQRTCERLHTANFEILTHRAVPPNDGGLALGQLMVAAHKESERCV